MADAHANFATSLVATAPSPATSGTSLVVTTGEGTRFPTVPFNMVIAPAGADATSANAEIVRVTARSTDTLTITRAQEGSSARTVVVGDRVYAGVTAKTLTDVESPQVPYLPFLQAAARASTSASSASVYLMLPNNADQATVSLSGAAAASYPTILKYIDSADLAISGKTTKLRVRGLVLTGTTLTNNVVVGLRAATLSGGNLTAGSLVTGTDATLTTPTANVANTAVSSDATLPSNGLYVPAYTVSATPNAAFVVHVTIEVHYV